MSESADASNLSAADRTRALQGIPAEVIQAIRSHAERFPPHIQDRGRAYLTERRVGSLEITDRRIGARVRGSSPYQTAWAIDGAAVHPSCSCPAGPICKHAFALALAIDDERGRVDLAKDFAHWARRHAEMPARTLRAVIGLTPAGPESADVWLEVRLTTPRVIDAPRTARQIVHLESELRGDPMLLSPPHARLLRVLARTVPLADGHAIGTRFVVEASALNRMLDGFSDSALVTWERGTTAPPDARGGVVPGSRLRLGDSAIDIVPVSSNQGNDMSIALAGRWPDGSLRRLEELVYLPSDDELNPSLVLADGAFWRVSEEPPPHLMRRLAQSGHLPVPETGRGRFLELLATSFTSVAEALAPHMRIHPARPLVTLDLDADDWLQVRLFAHTGEATWRPGSEASGVIAFELDADQQWARLDAVAPESAGAVEEPSTVWVEMPDPAPLEAARHWLSLLPVGPRDRRDVETEGTPIRLRNRGLWMRLGGRNLNAFADAWDRRPLDLDFLGNERMQSLIVEGRTIRPQVRVVASGVDWFTVSAEWQAEGLALTDEDLKKLRTARTRFVKLGSGWVRREWVENYDEAAAMLADLGLEAGAGEQRLTLAQLAQARPESLAALSAIGGDPETVREIERLRERVRAFEGLPKVPVPRRLKAILRPYQQEGFEFLAYVTGLGLGAILADDMGLGKTVQALAWIEWLRENDPDGGPVLVVCPASVVHNWQRESERFTPHLRVLSLTSGEERHTLRREVPNHDLVITNYALLRRDLDHWRSIPLRAAVLDEAQNIKNPNAAVSRAVLELDTTRRLALTGTPIENRALDLWSIMQFVNPGYLGRRAAFVARYDRHDAPTHARRLLAARLRPVMVRRLKEQVAPDLPDRIEERRECELTPGQRKLYLAELLRGRATVERLKSTADGLHRNKLEVLAAITRLRQVCCHPALVGGRESLGSGKFDALFEILEPLMEEGRKVLVFSQFVECLKLLAAQMKRRGMVYHMLTGATTKREHVVQAFESDPLPCVFLISLKAGGTGLNLTAASYVVLFDPWWNPAVEAQAIDRAHRIGQTRTVIAYRMLAAGTIEEKIWELQQRKAVLVAEVLGEDGFARTLTSEDLDYLLG
ncbi:MAG: DEAD/DEAH box helicase [Candidatus Eisenbacteria bacterium]|uniref:DEAD/DEAH box helicase n=1 Tax=Eiseniibacteriota bacterium TaxID=2212470 RepID=A0A849SR51_UNCEI|nr:DEAD/DEAH box helicase [Candidatus Eisenbacteria bacterium]